MMSHGLKRDVRVLCYGTIIIFTMINSAHADNLLSDYPVLRLRNE